MTAMNDDPDAPSTRTRQVLFLTINEQGTNEQTQGICKAMKSLLWNISVRLVFQIRNISCSIWTFLQAIAPGEIITPSPVLTHIGFASVSMF